MFNGLPDSAKGEGGSNLYGFDGGATASGSGSENFFWQGKIRELRSEKAKKWTRKVCGSGWTNENSSTR
jgi:hypothetical protein